MLPGTSKVGHCLETLHSLRRSLPKVFTCSLQAETGHQNLVPWISKDNYLDFFHSITYFSCQSIHAFPLGGYWTPKSGSRDVQRLLSRTVQLPYVVCCATNLPHNVTPLYVLYPISSMQISFPFQGTHMLATQIWCQRCRRTIFSKLSIPLHIVFHVTDERLTVSDVFGLCFTLFRHYNSHPCAQIPACSFRRKSTTEILSQRCFRHPAAHPSGSVLPILMSMQHWQFCGNAYRASWPESCVVTRLDA